MTRIVAIALTTALLPWAAAAQSCPGNPDALGTERTLTVDATTAPRVGRKQFRGTLLLTFDDGLWPTSTPKSSGARSNGVDFRLVHVVPAASHGGSN